MLTIFLTIFLSLFSTIVMSYISLATPIGPWIAPTLIFVGLVCSKFFFTLTTTQLSYAIIASSIGGIIATACAFSFPTLYFLDPITFTTWMQSPLFFCSAITTLSFLAGIFGLVIADMSEETLLNKQNLAFPIGQLSYKIITATDQIKKTYDLIIGFCSTAFFCIVQGKFPYAIKIIPPLTIQLDIVPMIWAIGFITGHVIAVPLAVGALSTIFITNPLQHYFFSFLSTVEFTLALCSGIIMYSSLISLFSMPQQIINVIKNSISHIQKKTSTKIEHLHLTYIFMLCLIISCLMLFFSYFKMPLPAQLYLIACSIITTYQISAIAGRIGLALLGRFATFVMIPAMLFFNINYTHLVFIATFVEISGGVATDVLFGRKLGQLAQLSRTTVRAYQLFGLLISSLTIGIIFWLLINHFGLGSTELCAYRAQSRQLLIQAHNFDYSVMIIGAFFGAFLQYMNLNPILVLGGLLMPLDITISLIVGGFIAYCSRNREEWFPFWSGVYASNSLYMVIKAIFIT